MDRSKKAGNGALYRAVLSLKDGDEGNQAHPYSAGGYQTVLPRLEGQTG